MKIRKASFFLIFKDFSKQTVVVAVPKRRRGTATATAFKTCGGTAIASRQVSFVLKLNKNY